MNVHYSPGDHFIIPDGVFVKKKEDKTRQREKPTPEGTGVE